MQHLFALPWPLYPSVLGDMLNGLREALKNLSSDALTAVLVDCAFADLLELSPSVRANAIAARCCIWPQVLDLRECLSPTRSGWQMHFAKNFLGLLHEKYQQQGRRENQSSPECTRLLSRVEIRTSELLQDDLAGVTCLHLHNSDVNTDLLQVLPAIVPSLTSLSHLIIDAPEVYRQLQLPELAQNEELGAPQYPWYHLALEYPGMSTIGAETRNSYKGAVDTSAFVALLDSLPNKGRLRAIVLRGVSLHITGVDDWGPALGKLDKLESLELDVISTGMDFAQHFGE